MSSSENTDRPAAGPGGVSPETRFERFKIWAENNRVLAALIVLAAIVAGAAAFTKSILELREFIVFLKTPRLEAVAGPGLLLAYERIERRVTFKFALALLQKESTGDIVESAAVDLNSEPPQYPISFSSSEVSCQKSGDQALFPISVPGGQWLRLDCTLTQQLGAESENAFLRPGFFRLKIRLDCRKSRQSSAEVCYYLMKEAVDDLRFGSKLPKTFTVGCNSTRSKE